MKTILLLFLLTSGFLQITFGQIISEEEKLRKQRVDSVDGWRRGVVFALTLSQTSLKNWAAGGQNSLAVNGLLNSFANYKSGKTIWDNSLDIGYGVLKQGKETDYVKTDDKIDFLSKYGRQAFGNFYYAALLNFKTQFAIGRDYAGDTSKISNFFAPAYLIGALGLDYKPTRYFSAFFAPLTGKITIVSDNDLSSSGAFGVEPGDKSKVEFGGYLRFIYSRNDFKNEFLKNVSFTSKIDFFSNYLRDPQNIDISWETLIALKVNRFIAVNISTHLLYDDDIKIETDTNNDGRIDESAPRVQFKEILGVGFTLQF